MMFLTAVVKLYDCMIAQYYICVGMCVVSNHRRCQCCIICLISMIPDKDFIVDALHTILLLLFKLNTTTVLVLLVCL